MERRESTGRDRTADQHRTRRGRRTAKCSKYHAKCVESGEWTVALATHATLAGDDDAVGQCRREADLILANLTTAIAATSTSRSSLCFACCSRHVILVAQFVLRRATRSCFASNAKQKFASLKCIDHLRPLVRLSHARVQCFVCDTFSCCCVSHSRD